MRNVLLIQALVLAVTIRSNAMRMDPAPVEPVHKDGIEFRADHTRMGVVEAWSMTSKEKLWEVQIYRVDVQPQLEGDVQWVFITSLCVDGNSLVVVNERNHSFRLDLNTHLVTSRDVPHVETIGPDRISEEPDIVVNLKILSFDQDALNALRKQSPLSADLLLAAWSSGKGRLLSAPTITAPSGCQSTVKACREFIYPTKFSLASPQATNAPASSPICPVPSDFETREVGTIMTVLSEFLAGTNHVTVVLSAEHHFQPEWRRYQTEFPGPEKASTATLELPFFSPVQVSTTVRVPVGASVLAGGGVDSPDGQQTLFFIVSAEVAEPGRKTSNTSSQGMPRSAQQP